MATHRIEDIAAVLGQISGASEAKLYWAIKAIADKARPEQVLDFAACALFYDTPIEALERISQLPLGEIDAHEFRTNQRALFRESRQGFDKQLYLHGGFPRRFEEYFGSWDNAVKVWEEGHG